MLPVQPSGTAVRAFAGFALVLLFPHATASREKPARPGTPPVIVVATAYPNMPAATVDKLIGARVTSWVGQAPGVRRIESWSRAGISVVKVSFEPDTDPRRARATITSLTLACMPYLPPGGSPPVVLPSNPAAPPLAHVTVTSPTLPLVMETDMASIWVQHGLGSVPGVLAPMVLGGVERVIFCDLDPTRLAARNLSPRDVAVALRRANAPLAPGAWYAGPYRMQLSADVALANIKELNDLPLDSKPGGNLFLRDVGHVEDGQAASTALVRINGRRTVCVPLSLQPGTDGRDALAAAEKALPKILKKLPKETRLQVLPLGDRAAGGLLTLHVRAPSNLRVSATERRVAVIEQVVKTAIPVRERTLLLSEVGLRPDWTAACSDNGGEHDATLRVRLTDKPAHSAREYAARLRRLLREDKRFADLNIRVDSGEPPVEVRIMGGTSAQGLKLAREVARLVRRMKGATDVRVVERQDFPVYSLKVDRKKAAAVGLSAQDVVAQAAVAFGSPGSLGGNVWIAAGRGSFFRVLVAYPEDPAKQREDVLKIPATGTTTPKPVRLDSLVEMRPTTEPVEVRRVNGKQVFTVRASAEGREAGAVARDVEKALKELTLPKGMHLEVRPKS